MPGQPPGSRPPLRITYTLRLSARAPLESVGPLPDGRVPSCTVSLSGNRCRQFQRGVAEFSVLLGPELFGTYVAELVEALETRRDAGAFRPDRAVSGEGAVMTASQ